MVYVQPRRQPGVEPKGTETKNKTSKDSGSLVSASGCDLDPSGKGVGTKVAPERQPSFGIETEFQGF